MTAKQSILLLVRQFVANSLGRSVEDDEKYFESGLVGSMFGVRMISFIENEFLVTVLDDDLSLDNFDSISSVTSFILSKSS